MPTDQHNARPAHTVLWFRRDLRLGDNPALNEAVMKARRAGGALLPVFVWEPRERRRWSPGAAARWWLWHSLRALDEDLRLHDLPLAVHRGDPVSVLPEVAVAGGAGTVVWAAGLEPDEVADDEAVSAHLGALGVHSDVVPSANLLFSQRDVRTRQGGPYTVFTPYWRACLRDANIPRTLATPPLPPGPRSPGGIGIDQLRGEALTAWTSRFEECWRPGESGGRTRLGLFLDGSLHAYDLDRDRPDRDATSRLSPHLHWGELSARQVWHGVADVLNEAGLGVEPAVAPATTDGARSSGLQQAAGAFLRQLGWREFAHHLLIHHPQMPDRPLREDFIRFGWRDDPGSLEAWRTGRTGYPLVDAGMRQLLATGWMHNRARLVAASFLVKDLLLTWRDGEDWFWEALVDADLADNSLGWQWVAGSGADASPYFRIFNPSTQARRYDPRGEYVRRWVPESAGGQAMYQEPLVEHGEARSRALAAYADMRRPQA